MSAQNAPEDPRADVKAKMREALAKKQAAQHASAASARNTGSVHGPEVTGNASQKMFRRKSG